MITIGIDTSNYTTSCARFDTETQTIVQEKRLLPVPDGQAGLRQSDAVFHHTKQLPELLEALAERCGGLCADAYGVSTAPRSAEGSYMPCFLAGIGTAQVLAAAVQRPLHRTSHQMGHILAALYSAGQLAWLRPDAPPFLAFHVSGGTTDCVCCTPNPDTLLTIDPVSSSLDLKAGQAIDRVGLMLGLQFPCGPALERLAANSHSNAHGKITLRNGCCSLSGLQNQCEALYKRQTPPADIARYCLNTVAETLRAMTLDALNVYPNAAVLYAGGVMSNRLIQQALQAVPTQTAFSEPAFSCDNAAGIAIYAAYREVSRLCSA